MNAAALLPLLHDGVVHEVPIEPAGLHHLLGVLVLELRDHGVAAFQHPFAQPRVFQAGERLGEHGRQVAEHRVGGGRVLDRQQTRRSHQLLGLHPGDRQRHQEDLQQPAIICEPARGLVRYERSREQRQGILTHLSHRALVHVVQHSKSPQRVFQKFRCILTGQLVVHTSEGTQHVHHAVTTILEGQIAELFLGNQQIGHVLGEVHTDQRPEVPPGGHRAAPGVLVVDVLPADPGADSRVVVPRQTARECQPGRHGAVLRLDAVPDHLLEPVEIVLTAKQDPVLRPVVDLGHLEWWEFRQIRIRLRPEQCDPGATHTAKRLIPLLTDGSPFEGILRHLVADTLNQDLALRGDRQIQITCQNLGADTQRQLARLQRLEEDVERLLGGTHTRCVRAALVPAEHLIGALRPETAQQLGATLLGAGVRQQRLLVLRPS